ncbi:L-histidine N(alpha)-methyltransferase [Streptomyces sp. BHT-5-2]|nr:L-histidine N(alpha)-methyltransferase [Streptomyces sp. BHT-5-2]
MGAGGQPRRRCGQCRAGIAKRPDGAPQDPPDALWVRRGRVPALRRDHAPTRVLPPGGGNGTVPPLRAGDHPPRRVHRARGPGGGERTQSHTAAGGLAHEQRLTAYTGVDVCAQPLREAARRIKQRWPDAEVTTVHSDFDHGLSWLRGRTEYRLLALLGSTYGNLSQVERRRFLDGVRRCCGPTDRLLLCIDQPQRLVGALHAAQRRQAETEPAAERHTTALVGDPLLERRVGGRVAAGPVSDDAAFHSLRVEFHGLGHTGQMECVVGDAGARLGTGATPEEGGLRFVVATSVHVEAHGEVEEVRHERGRRPVARQQLAAERALYVPC